MPESQNGTTSQDITRDQALEIVQQSARDYQKAGGQVRILAMGEQGTALFLYGVQWCQKHAVLFIGNKCQKCQNGSGMVGANDADIHTASASH